MVLVKETVFGREGARIEYVCVYGRVGEDGGFVGEELKKMVLPSASVYRSMIKSSGLPK